VWLFIVVLITDEEGAKIANDNVYFIHCDMNSEDEIKVKF
jgi:hypothetical protein